MKILDAYRFEVKARDYYDMSENSQLAYLVDKIVGVKPIGVIDSDTKIYIPYHLWVGYGGNPSITPSHVVIVHGLEDVTTNLEDKQIKRRPFLVPDQASSNGFAPRIHLCAYRKNHKDGTLRKVPDSVYCGQTEEGHAISHCLDEVTCPECLQELKRINPSH